MAKYAVKCSVNYDVKCEECERLRKALDIEIHERKRAELAVRMAAPEVLEQSVQQHLYKLIREWDF
jgi:hypothetical protein